MSVIKYLFIFIMMNLLCLKAQAADAAAVVDKEISPCPNKKQTVVQASPVAAPARREIELVGHKRQRTRISDDELEKEESAKDAAVKPDVTESDGDSGLAPEPTRKRRRIIISDDDEPGDNIPLSERFASQAASASSSSASGAAATEAREKAHASRSVHENFAKVVKESTSRREVTTKLKITNATFNSYASKARRYGLLTMADTEFIDRDKRLSMQLLSDRFVKMVKEKKPREEIIAYCAENAFGEANAKNPERYFIHLLAWSYENKKLTTAQTLYLKKEKAVIERNDVTKSKILAFMEDQAAKGARKMKLKELAELFNQGLYKVSRPILGKTFAEHLRELLKNERLEGLAKEYYLSCNQKTAKKQH